MPAPSSRVDPRAIARVSPGPAAGTAPAPNREDTRLSRLRITDWGTQFALRLRTNVKWMKKFLHGGK